MFSLCPPFRGGGGSTPSQVCGWGGPNPRSVAGGYPFPGLWLGGYPSQVWVGGTLSQVWMGGVPGVPPSQVWKVGVGTWVPPGQVWMWGDTRVPPYQQDWMGYPPPPGLDGYVPPTTRTGWVRTPHHQDWMGYPLARSGWWGYVPPPPGLDGVPPHTPPIRQSSIASTCYAAGGMPLAFTQEDFLVN